VKLYEGMFIFPESMKDEALDAAVGRVREEIEKFGGKIENVTRLGKRTFARPMKKQKAGQYAVIGFSLSGGKIVELRERLKLSADVFRAQIAAAGAMPAAPAAKGADDGGSK